MTCSRRWEVACGVDFSDLMDTALQAPDHRCAVRRVSDGETVLSPDVATLYRLDHCELWQHCSSGRQHLFLSAINYLLLSHPCRDTIFFFKTPRPAVGPTQPAIQWVPEFFHRRLSRPGRELDHLTPSTVEVKNEWSYTFTPQHAFMT